MTDNFKALLEKASENEKYRKRLELPEDATEEQARQVAKEVARELGMELTDEDLVFDTTDQVSDQELEAVTGGGKGIICMASGATAEDYANLRCYCTGSGGGGGTDVAGGTEYTTFGCACVGGGAGGNGHDRHGYCKCVFLGYGRANAYE